ncbi:MAG: PAS domain-containing protein [Thalassobaculum sp.]
MSTIPIERLIGPDDPVRMRDFVDYWMSKRGDRLLPAFADIDPIDIPWALSHTYVVEARPDGDFVYRLAGEAVSQRYNRSLKGTRISDLFTERSSQRILERWAQVIAAPVGYYSHSQHTTTGGSAVRARRVVLPLGADGSKADHLMGYTVFETIQTGDEQFGNGVITQDLRWAELTR